MEISARLKQATAQFYFCAAVFVLLLKGLWVWLPLLFLLYTHTHQECYNPHKPVRLYYQKKSNFQKKKQAQCSHRTRNILTGTTTGTSLFINACTSLDLISAIKRKACKLTNDLQIHPRVTVSSRGENWSSHEVLWMLKGSYALLLLSLLSIWPNFTTSETGSRTAMETNHFNCSSLKKGKGKNPGLRLPEAGSGHARPLRNSVWGLAAWATQEERTSLMLSERFLTSQGTSHVT